MDLDKFVQRFARRHRLLLARISRAEELADGLACDLADLEQTMRSGRPVTAEARRGRVRFRDLAKGSANVRARSVSVRRRADDWGVIQVDQGAEFTLPPILTDLFVVLSAESGQSDDDLVAWKPLEEVARRLAKKAGRAFSRHSVTQHIHRLRRELFARGGASPLLVQTNRRLGVRLALQRPPRPELD